MRSLILSALILASTFRTALGAVEGQWTYIIENGGASIITSSATGAVTIPSSLGGYAVKMVGGVSPPRPIFGESSTLVTSITIPNSVTGIGFIAFAGCDGLTTLTIPNSVTSIGDYAFYFCTSLTSVIIPNSVTSIGKEAFRSCTSLTSVGIPNSVTSIGKDAFKYCTALSSVYLPVRFETTYTNFGLTGAQVPFYDPTSPSYLAGQESVINNPSAHNLYTATQYNANFTAGENNILNSPNSNGLYTTSQIQDMSMGGLVLTKNGNGFTLNYTIEKSNDLGAWTQYQSFTLPLSGLSPDKAFVRLKMANSSSGSSSQATDQAALAAAQAAYAAAQAALVAAQQAEQARIAAILNDLLKDAQAKLATAQANLAAAQSAGDPAAQADALANLEAAQVNLEAAQVNLATAQANLATAQASAQVPPFATPVGSNL